ncbi:MAG TPA: hypothetical protein VF981_05150 [Gemmatimonadaceae bacterium]
MRVHLLTVFLWALLSNAACYAYRPVATAPSPGSTVRIVLASATAVTTIESSGTRRLHPDVLEASGTVQAAAADTMAVRLGALRTATGAIPQLSGQIALLPTNRVARIEVRRFQAGTTALAGVALATIAVAGFLVVIIAALTRGF